MTKASAKNAKRCGLPITSLATLRLLELAQVAAIMRAAGEILPAGPWARVICNILSAVPPKERPRQDGASPPADYLSFNIRTVDHHLSRCGFKCSSTEIAAFVADTQAWRARMSERAGKPHRVMIGMDKIGQLLGITETVRREAEAWNIGTYDGSPRDRAEAKAERSRLRKAGKRRAAGAKPREEYEKASLSSTRPWELEGMSRRTWERKRKKENAMGEVINFEEHRAKRAGKSADQQAVSKPASSAAPEAQSIVKTKPWEAEGMPRSTW